MGVSMDADFRQVHNCHVAAMVIYYVPPLPRHLQSNSPSILAGIVTRLLGDEVTVENDDGNLGKLHELGHRHADG